MLHRELGDPRVGRALIAPGSWFQTLPAALQAELACRARPLFLQAGERLCARGDPPDGLYGLSDGILRVGSTGDGGEALLAMVQPPHWFGEVGLFDGSPRTHDVHAETDVVLLHLPQTVMLAVLEREPEGWRHLGRMLAGKMRSVFVSATSAGFSSSPKRSMITGIRVSPSPMISRNRARFSVIARS